MKKAYFDIVKEYECDVLVAGGGVSGFSAAVCAARLGARVILCDASGMLGGTATSGLVGPFMTCYDHKGEKQIIKGFFNEVVDRLVAEGAAIHPSVCKNNMSYSGYRMKGHDGVTPFSSEKLLLLAEELCLEAGVKILYHSRVIGCECNNDRIEAVYISTPAGVEEIRAKNYIDTTGSASLAEKAGAEVVFGDENGAVQTATTFFQITGVNKEALDAHMRDNYEMRARFFMDEIEKARKEGKFPCGTPKLRIYETVDGIWKVNMAQQDDYFNDTDTESITKAEIYQRKQIPQLFDFLKNNIPGLEDIRLLNSASEIGIRESRRIVGKTVFTGDDAINSRYADEQIAVCSNSIDIHLKSEVKYVVCEKNYYIPFSCLVSKNIKNLLAAGKCLSADKYAFAAVRVMPPCFAMGEAVGIAAAIASKQRISACDVNVKEIQKQIIDNGGYLELDS